MGTWITWTSRSAESGAKWIAAQRAASNPGSIKSTATTIRSSFMPRSYSELEAHETAVPGPKTSAINRKVASVISATKATLSRAPARTICGIVIAPLP